MKTRRALSLLAALVTSGPAFAVDSVSSPNVEKRKFTLEYRGGYDTDDNPSKDRKQPNKLVMNYGLTDRLRPEIKAVIDNDPNDAPDLTAIELGLRYQFLKKDEAWLAAAIDGTYTAATKDGDPDTFEAKFLLAKDFGDLATLANIGAETELGGDSESGLALKFAWKSSYKINPHFAPGFEYYADTGNLRHDPGFDEQGHKIGPTVSGEIVDGLKYDVGYLWGLSDSTTDGRAKFILSYATSF